MARRFFKRYKKMEEVEKNKPQKSDPSDSNTKPQSKPIFL